MTQVSMIIGHGRSPEGKRWGEFIDTADRVVRMWECDWQDPADLGSKYTHGIVETARKVLRRFYHFHRSKPSAGWVISYLDEFGRAPVMAPPKPGIIWDQRLWTLDPQLGKAVGGVGETGRWELTRGGFAGCWAIQTAPAGALVVMVGCDNLERGQALPVQQAFGPAYVRDPACAGVDDYQCNAHKTGNHDFAAERDLLELLAIRRSVVLQWGL